MLEELIVTLKSGVVGDELANNRNRQQYIREKHEAKIALAESSNNFIHKVMLEDEKEDMANYQNLLNEYNKVKNENLSMKAKVHQLELENRDLNTKMVKLMEHVKYLMSKIKA